MMKDMEFLKDNKAWVVFTFKDGSKRTIYTTLSEHLLTEAGAFLRTDYLYDFNRSVYVPFRDDITDIAISEDKPVFESEVLKFANRFI